MSKLIMVFRVLSIVKLIWTDEDPAMLFEKMFEPHHLKRRRVKVSELNEEENDITRLALAIANETGLPFYKISATELVSGITGSSVIHSYEYMTLFVRF